ncbi:hypothetical protein GCM10009624_22440 [Gordonia sinesedis]
MSAGNDPTAGDAAAAAEATAPDAPVLRIVGGNPTDEDIAVLVTVFAAASGAATGGGEPGPRDDWGRPVDMFRPQWGAPTSFTNLGF